MTTVLNNRLLCNISLGIDDTSVVQRSCAVADLLTVGKRDGLSFSSIVQQLLKFLKSNSALVDKVKTFYVEFIQKIRELSIRLAPLVMGKIKQVLSALPVGLGTNFINAAESLLSSGQSLLTKLEEDSESDVDGLIDRLEDAVRSVEFGTTSNVPIDDFKFGTKTQKTRGLTVNQTASSCEATFVFGDDDIISYTGEAVKDKSNFVSDFTVFREVPNQLAVTVVKNSFVPFYSAFVGKVDFIETTVTAGKSFKYSGNYRVELNVSDAASNVSLQLLKNGTPVKPFQTMRGQISTKYFLTIVFLEQFDCNDIVQVYNNSESFIAGGDGGSLTMTIKSVE